MMRGQSKIGADAAIKIKDGKAFLEIEYDNTMIPFTFEEDLVAAVDRGYNRSCASNLWRVKVPKGTIVTHGYDILDLSLIDASGKDIRPVHLVGFKLLRHGMVPVQAAMEELTNRMEQWLDVGYAEQWDEVKAAILKDIEEAARKIRMVVE